MKSFFSKLAPYCMVLLAFAVRLYKFDVVRFPHDFAIPYSYGLGIVESVHAGQWHELPLLGLSSGVQILNPIGASYIWALVALLDRSPLLAMVISIALNTVAVAMTYDLGRRLLGRRSAIAATILMACSIYGVYIARGTWIQGQLEFGAVCSAWLLWPALQRRQPRRILLAFAFVALFMHTYLVAIGLASLAIGCGLLTLLWPRSPAQPTLNTADMAALTHKTQHSIVIGSVMCLFSVAFFGALLLTQNESGLISFNNNPANHLQAAPAAGLDAVRNALLPVNGSDFDFNRVIDGTWDYRLDDPAPWLNTLFAGLVSALVGLGLLRLSWMLLRQDKRFTLNHACMLLWFIVPILIGQIAQWQLPHLGIRQQYLLLTAPAGYLLAGMLFLPSQRDALRAPVLAWGMRGLVVLALLNGPPRIFANVDVIAAKPYYDRLDFLPLREQLKIGQHWRTDCREIANPQLHYWTASLLQDTQHIRPGGAQVNAHSNVWQVLPDGGTCTTRIATEPPLLNSLPIGVDLASGPPLITYLSLPVNLRDNQPEQPRLWLNLNWRLLHHSAPTHVSAGTPITLTHVWRIELLPEAKFAAWHYTLYLNLKTPQGRLLPLIQDGLLPAGALWRQGDYIFSQLYASLPKDLSSGNYELQLSLYDPARKDTAVHVELNRNGEPDWGKPHPYLSYPVHINHE